MTDVLISGYYGFNNLGDDAILRTVVENVKGVLPDCHITVLSNSPQDTREKYGVDSAPRMSFFGIIRAVRNCDLLISGGGSLLQDVTSRISILYYLFIILLGVFFRKKVFIYSQGIGPIRGKLNRKLTAWTLRKTDAVAVRDSDSAQFLISIGVPAEKITVTADPVLRLKPESTERGLEILEKIGVKKSPGRRLVGWAIKSEAANPRFIDEIEKSIRGTADDPDTDCILIPFHYKQDIPVIEELRRRLGNGVFAVTEKLLSEDMLSLIGNLDLLVGVRLHSLIYATLMDVPFIGISYDPKIDAFLSSVGRESLSSTKDFTAELFFKESDKFAGRADGDKLEGLIDRFRQNDELLSRIASDAGENKKGAGVGGVIGSVMLITVLAKLLGIVRESAQASVFGTADSFYAAYNKTIYLFTTVAYAMCVAAVPIMTKAVSKDRREGIKTSDSLVTFTMLISLLGTAVWILLTFISGAESFWGVGSSEALSFVRIMALSLPIVTAAYMMVALMQSLDHYALQGSMSLPYSLFLVVYLFIFGRRLSLTAYVAVVSFAWLLQLAMCLPYALKERYLFVPRLKLSSGDAGAFVKTAAVTIVTNSMYLLCYLLDSSRASELGQGVTSAFYYADKLFTPLTTTFIYSISAVMFPRLNREYSKASKTDYLRYVWQITSNTLLIVFPVTALLIVFGQPILKVLFESGSFTADSTAETASIFIMYALGMAGFSAIDMLSKAFFAMGKRIVPLAVSIGVIALNFALNAVFGVTGAMLALTTAASLTVGAIAAMALLFRGEKIASLSDMGKSAAASLVMGAAAYGLRTVLVNGAEGKILLVIKCGLIGVVVMLIFVALCWAMRLDPLISAIKRRGK